MATFWPATLYGALILRGPPDVCVALEPWAPNPVAATAKSAVAEASVKPLVLLFKPPLSELIYTLAPDSALVSKSTHIFWVAEVTVDGSKLLKAAVYGGLVSASTADTSMSKVMLGATVAAVASGPYSVSVNLPWKALTLIL